MYFYDKKKKNIIKKNFLEIKEDNFGNIWLGGYDGLSKYSNPANIFENFKTTNLVSIYPNPANSFITVHSFQEEILNIELLNITGDDVLKVSRSGKNVSLSVESFTSGIYFMKIFTVSGKIIIEKFIITE